MNQLTTSSRQILITFRHFATTQKPPAHHPIQITTAFYTKAHDGCQNTPQTASSRPISSTLSLKNQRRGGSWKWPTTTNRETRVKTGNRVWYPPVTTDDDARNLVLNLDPTGRRLLMRQLEVVDEKSEVFQQEMESVPTEQFCKVFLVNCLPFIGFGFLDNGIMIIAGEYIDAQLGLLLGLSTMAAAALGNLISDLAGVGTAGYIENLVEKVKVIQPQLKPTQFNYTSVRWATSMGRALGITIGCLLGMIPLLFFDDNKGKKRRHAKDCGPDCQCQICKDVKNAEKETFRDVPA